MKNNLVIVGRFLFSFRFTNTFFLLLSIVYALATFGEKYYGIAFARKLFYNNPVVYLILFLGIVNMVGMFYRGNYLRRKNSGMLIFHFSFIIILLGALITNIWGYEGKIHLRQGDVTKEFFDSDRIDEKYDLPFSIKLNEFTIKRYPGSNSPSSYESDLIIYDSQQEKKELLQMNKVVVHKGFRLYQSSYDQDEKGSVLIVNYDPIGTIVTYSGYALLILGVLLMMFSRHSRFRSLIRQLNKIAVMLFLCQWASIAGLKASENIFESSDQHITSYLPSRAHAIEFGKLNVQCSSGRTEPINTYASKLIRKICGKNAIGSYCPEQILLGMIVYPEYWRDLSIIRQENKQIAQITGTNVGNITFNSLFDKNGEYVLHQLIGEIYNKPVKERTKYDKDIIKLDERINIIYALQQGEMLAIYPLKGDKAKKWYSPGDDLSPFLGKDSLFVNKIFHWYLTELDAGIQQGEWAQADEIINMIKTFQQARSDNELIDQRRLDAELLYNRMDILGNIYLIYIILGTILILVSFFGILYRHVLFSLSDKFPDSPQTHLIFLVY